jgi:membrane associated rhomboid family serine protease
VAPIHTDAASAQLKRAARETRGCDERRQGADKPKQRGLTEGESPPFLSAASKPWLAWNPASGLCGLTPRKVSPVQQREPLFNIPPVITFVIALLILVHVGRLWLLSAAQDQYFLNLFAFIPARYDNTLLLGEILPGGWGAEIWTFVTYSLIHADWIHLGVNTVWFLPFGSAIARRFGPIRFLAFFAVTAAAGAMAHLFAHGGDNSEVVGASAAISGTMAGAMRFAFQRGGPLGARREGGADPYRVPAIPLLFVLTDPRVLAFLVVWFGVNILFGIGSLPLTGAGQTVAWQAHIGGFLAGLLLFSWFDPPPEEPRNVSIGAMPH